MRALGVRTGTIIEPVIPCDASSCKVRQCVSRSPMAKSGVFSLIHTKGRCWNRHMIAMGLFSEYARLTHRPMNSDDQPKRSARSRPRVSSGALACEISSSIEAIGKPITRPASSNSSTPSSRSMARQSRRAISVGSDERALDPSGEYGCLIGPTSISALSSPAKERKTRSVGQRLAFDAFGSLAAEFAGRLVQSVYDCIVAS